MSLPNYYQDPNVLHINRIPHHAYFIPFQKGQTPNQLEREKSNQFTLLNGEWHFNFYESLHDLPDNFLNTTLLTKSLCRLTGKHRALILINTLTSTTRFHSIRLMYRTIIPVVFIGVKSSLNPSQTNVICSILRAWIPACLSM